MGQSESGYIKEKLEQLNLEAARRKGQLARTQGLSSAENPFLTRDFMPSQSGLSEQDWFRDCDAWWRGWDAEDLRRRSRHAVGREEAQLHARPSVLRS